MPVATVLMRASSLNPHDSPTGYVLVFQLGGFSSPRARSPRVSAWAFDLLDLPIGHGFAHGSDEERVEAFYAQHGSVPVLAAADTRDGHGPIPVEPTAGAGRVWAFTAHERPYAQRWYARALSLTAWALPIGGWLRQGYACERIRRLEVAQGGSDYLAAVSNEGSAHAHRMRERFGDEEPSVE